MTKFGNPLFNEVSPHKDGRKYEFGDWQKLPEIIHDEERIHGFFGGYRWLSNFGGAVVMLDGVTYGSVEVAYQAAKWQPEDRAFFWTCTNRESISYNRTYAPNGYTPEGRDETKRDVMEFLLEQKFNPEFNPENAERLLATGERDLKETNWWGDVYWGRQLDGSGDNHLGELLMEARSRLKQGLSSSLD